MIFCISVLPFKVAPSAVLNVTELKSNGSDSTANLSSLLPGILLGALDSPK